MTVEVVPAATVVLLREHNDGLQTLLLKRSSELQFANSVWVFPGGRIDPQDYADQPEDLLNAARAAAVRETREEAALQIELNALHHFAHWTTPPARARRFATWFFVAPVLDRGEVVVDGSEIVQHRWIRPAQALDEHRNNALDLMPPTFVTLTELAAHASIDQVLRYYREREVQYFSPRPAMQPAIVMLYEGDAGYASGDAELPGARHRTIKEQSGWRYEKTI